MPEPNEEVKVTFTPEQQAKLDQIVQDRMAAARQEAAAEATAARKEAKEAKDRADASDAALAVAKASHTGGNTTDVEALQATIKEMKAAGESTQAEQKRLEKLIQVKDKEVETARSQATQVKKQIAMRDVASSAGFVDVSDVLELTDKFVKWDDTKGRFIVLNDAGTERLNASYEAMSLAEYYAEYAAKKPHLVRSDVRGGAGSGGSQRTEVGAGKYKVEDVFGAKSDSRKASELFKKDPAEYRHMKLAAKEMGLID
jgi:hypothetical protein